MVETRICSCKGIRFCAHCQSNEYRKLFSDLLAVVEPSNSQVYEIRNYEDGMLPGL